MQEDSLSARRKFPVFYVLFLCAACVGAHAGDSTKRAPDVHWEPSPPEVVTAMLELAGVQKDDIVYDLGCGDGRIVIAAARDFGARGVGIDIDPVRIAESKENALKAGVADRVEFREEDLFEADFHDATVVILFLWPELNLKLRPALMRQLKPGTRVVSYIHDMGEWLPAKEMIVNVRSVYLWTIPAGK
jgi:methylase of polypeptide subunit release factors